MRILVATEKPFAKMAVDGIKEIAKESGHEIILLENYKAVEELYKAVENVDALIIRSDKVTPKVVDAAKQLKIVVRAGAGYDNVDLESCTKRNIVVMNTPGQNSNAVAELAIE
ncbi:NAD(P)-dependent oxidoreductase [Entamoeba marina]